MSRVTFEGCRYPLRPGETVLDALLRGGANVSFSCRKGTCHVCMLRAVDGDPGEEARVSTKPGMRELGYFLPCTARPEADLEIERPSSADLFVRARVHEKTALSPSVMRILLEPEINLTWRAGQFVNLRRMDGVARSYSIASIAEEDYFLEIHVRRVADGVVSRWLCDELSVDDEIELQGPIGTCFYRPEDRDRDLLLLATGTGLSPVLGVARDALRLGHQGRIVLFHGSHDEAGLYHQDVLRGLAAQHERFEYVPCVSRGEAPAGFAAGRVTDAALTRYPELAGWVVYLSGRPEMVYEARARVHAAGAARADVHADPFEPSHPYQPDDAAKIASIEPDPELWAALRHGEGLSEILRDFYGRVYEDPRLAPFFHNVTKQRAIEKQYAFLQDLFTGQRQYFGLRPFNAHHWMVISDELFDYREALFDSCLRRYGLSDDLIRRWGALHERFRRELVKSSPRGLIVDGVEHTLERYEEETLSIGSLCDGCGEEMAPGVVGRFHVRTGQLYCGGCAARRVGNTVRPPAPT